MIVEQRTYTLKIGAVPEYLELYEKEGLAIQRPILGRMVGYFSSDIGQLHQIVHMWAYKDLGERQERRAILLNDPPLEGLRQKDWTASNQPGKQNPDPCPFQPVV